MLRSYDDILALAAAQGRAPLWWDGNGVPRFVPFRPKHCGVYDRVAALVEIECQQCAAAFLVALESDLLGLRHGGEPPDATERGALAEWLHYGYPPARGHANSCVAGATMKSIPRRVVEFWRRGRATDWEWRRLGEYEGGLTCEWAHDTR